MEWTPAPVVAMVVVDEGPNTARLDWCQEPGGIPISGVVPIAVGRAKAPGKGRMRQSVPAWIFETGPK